MVILKDNCNGNENSLNLEGIVWRANCFFRIKIKHFISCSIFKLHFKTLLKYIPHIVETFIKILLRVIHLYVRERIPKNKLSLTAGLLWHFSILLFISRYCMQSLMFYLSHKIVLILYSASIIFNKKPQARGRNK